MILQCWWEVKMNKKGDITVTIFVIGVVALCFFALLSFYLSSGSTSDNFKNLDKIQSVRNKIELKIKDIDTIGGNKYYLESVSTSSLKFWQTKRILLEVAYPLK